MGVKLYIRDAKGRFIKGDMTEAEKEIDLFGSRIIRDGRNILTSFKKSSVGNLYRDYKFNVTYFKNRADLSLSFGQAIFYWRFVNEGVRGAGYPRRKPKSKRKNKQGLARGMGSPFKFSLKQPPLRPILEWVQKKGLRAKSQKGLAFYIASEIKAKGLPRTQFVTRPIKNNFKKVPDKIIKGLAMDLERLLKKLPDPMEEINITLQV
jgi:hypothetical protein